MGNQSAVSELAKGIVFLHGISGGGKGEVVKEISKLANTTGVNVLYVASGDLFRKLSRTPEDKLTPEIKEIAQTMKAGGYIPTLEGIMPELEKVFQDYFTKVLKGEKVVLLLDGFLRNGEFVGDQGKYDGVTIPSQVDQVAEAALRGLKLTLDSDPLLVGKLDNLDSEFCQSILNRTETPYIELKKDRSPESFAEQAIIGAKHVLIQIPPEDGNNLMKFRFQKALQKVSMELNMALMDGNQMSPEHINETFGLLKEAILIQSGRFTVQHGELVVDEKLEDRSFEILTDEETKLAGEELSKSIAQVVQRFGFAAKQPESFPGFVKDLLKVNGLAFDLGDLRDDDQGPNSRKKRTDEYRDKAKSRMIEGELGVRFDGYVILEESLGPNMYKVENGPSVGITYPKLVENAGVVARKLITDLPSLGGELESIHRGER